jgi:pyrroloquinoline quinone biosynthesis protein D
VTTTLADATLDTVPRIGPGFRLQFEPAQDCHVLLYPEGMVKLNGPAGEIMKRCDGEKNFAAVVAELEAAFSTTGLQGDVLAFAAMARQQRWLVWA